MKFEHTNRGFSYIEFKDEKGVVCSLQKSSIATDDCIWFGANEIGLKHFKAGQGWEEVKLINNMEEHFIANNKMHLTQKQVALLLPILQRFVETGEITYEALQS